VETCWEEATWKTEVFWVMTPCSVAVGYRRFGGPRCLHVHPEVENKNKNKKDAFVFGTWKEE